MSSFDQKYAFDAELAKAKQTNGANVTPAFENRIKAELAQAKATLGESSPQYIQLQRSIVAFANIYDSQKHDLSAAFDTLHRKSIEAVASEVARLKEDAGVKSDYHESGFNLKTAARKINVKSSVDQYLGDLKFDFHNISPDERKKLESKKFSLTSKESWQETGLLLGEDFANSVKDIALFFGSIPGSLVAIPEYISLRKDRNSKLKNEATLALMLEEFPALALLDLATDWDKGATMLKEIGTKLISGTQGDIAFTITSLIGLLAGGAGVAGKISGIAGKLARAGEKALKKTAVKVGETGGKLAKGAAAITAAGSVALGGAAYAGEVIAVAGSKIARAGGAIDNVTSGQFAVAGAAKGAEKLARGTERLEVPKGLKDTGMTPEEYSEMVATNAKLSPEVRATETAKTLGLENLSDIQKIALEKAHNTGKSGAGKWTQAELKAKIEILREGGFDKTQTRIILEHGYAGGAIRKLSSTIADAVKTVWEKARERFGKNKKVDISESAHGAPLEPRGDNVRILASEKLPVPKQEIIRNFVGNMKENEVKPLTNIGLPGWHVEKMPQGSAKANNVYELSIPGKNPIHIEGKGNLEKTIQQEVRQVNDSAIGKTIATPTDTIVIKENPKSMDTLPNIRVQLESIPKGTGETDIKIGDKKYTVNRHMDDKIDVAINGEVKTYNSIDDFLKDIGGDTGKRRLTTHDDIHKNLHDLQIRRDELKKWKDEYPGNVTYDADLMRTETEIAKINKQLASNNQNTGVKVEGNTTESAIKPGHNLVIRGEQGTGKVTKESDVKTPGKGVTIEGEFTRVDDTTAPKSEGPSRKGSPEKEYVGFGEEKFPYDRAGLPKLKEDFAADKVKLNELLAERARASEKGDTNAVKKLDDAIEAQKRKVIYGEDLIRRATQADNEATIVAKGTPKERENWLKKWWGLIPLALLLACLLSHCSEEGKKHGGVGTPGPLPTNPTPADILKSCESCYSGPESTLDFRRQNEYGQTLTEKYRNNITRRWMTGKEWKNFVKAFNQNKEKLSVLSGSSQKSVVKAVEAVLGGATTENIKQLQKCIGMFDAVYNNKKGQHYMKDNLDHKGAQDGILGPITTKKLMDFINICTNQPEKTETPPDRSDASIQEASPVDAMANSPGLFGV